MSTSNPLDNSDLRKSILSYVSPPRPHVGDFVNLYKLWRTHNAWYVQYIYVDCFVIVCWTGKRYWIEWKAWHLGQLSMSTEAAFFTSADGTPLRGRSRELAEDTLAQVRKDEEDFMTMLDEALEEFDMQAGK